MFRIFFFDKNSIVSPPCKREFTQTSPTLIAVLSKSKQLRKQYELFSLINSVRAFCCYRLRPVTTDHSDYNTIQCINK